MAGQSKSIAVSLLSVRVGGGDNGTLYGTVHHKYCLRSPDQWIHADAGAKHKHSPRFLRGSMAFDWDVPAPFFTWAAFFLLPNMMQRISAPILASPPVAFPVAGSRLVSAAGGQQSKSDSLAEKNVFAAAALLRRLLLMLLSCWERRLAKPSACWCHWDWIYKAKAVWIGRPSQNIKTS